MSDFYRGKPNPTHSLPQQEQWEQEDAWNRRDSELQSEAYPESPLQGENDALPQEDGVDPFAAWRRPNDAPSMGSGFLAEDPAPFGAEMLGGGVPLFDANQSDQQFRLMGDSAPTRIATPVQMVNKRTTVADENPSRRPAAPYPVQERKPEDVAQPERPITAPQAEQPQDATAAPRRRRSRMERRSDEKPVQQENAFDPFQAGDSELPTNEPLEQGNVRRPAVPGGRYTGARTAMPAQPTNGTDQKGDLPFDSIERNQDYGAQKPVAQPRQQPRGPVQRRPIPQGQERTGLANAPSQTLPPSSRPMPVRNGVRPDPQGRINGEGMVAPQRPRGNAQQNGELPRRPSMPRRPLPPEDDMPVRKQAPAGQPPVGDNRRPPQGRAPYDTDKRQPQASVNRKPYDFENEAEEPEKHHSVLVPILVVLLIIGGALAALCLPDWENMGGIGSTIAPVKAKVVAAFTSVKNMVLPEEDPLKSFSVSTADTVAPASLRLTVQSSRQVTGIRIEDDNGNTIYDKDYSDQYTMSGEVIENSNALIWTPVYTMAEEYIGGFTVYAKKADGTESEGLRTATTVNIAAPKPVMPPVQSFTTSAGSGSVPASVIFTLETSTDVTAVRIMDQYKSPVAALSLNDMNDELGAMSESGDVRTWTLYTEITVPYAGEYTAQYQTAEDELNYIDSTYTVKGEYTEAEELPESTAEPEQKEEVSAVVAPTQSEPVTTTTPLVTPTPTVEPTATPTPTPEPTLAPDSTPLPALSAAASEEVTASLDTMKLKATLYSGGKTVESFTRSSTISLLNPFTTYAGGSDYAIWKQAGVLTFRSGPLRQNAAYGTADVQSGKLTEAWKQDIGSMKVSGGDVLYGVNAPGQPVIVKWPTEVRQRMAILDEMRNVVALKEVIVAAQDGKIYFYNLLDGTPTREAYDLGAPSAGGLSVATNGTPILGVGQSHSKLASKTVKSGYHLINLLKNTEALLINTDGKERNSNYSGVLGSALFDSKTGSMIFGSQGGVLYTVELGKQSETYDYQAGKVTLGSTTQAYKSTVKGQDSKNTNIDSSVAMYNQYVYYGDRYGVVQCVDVNTLTNVWAFNSGDSIDATVALDLDDESTVALYTGNTILLQRKGGVCTLRRLNALTGDVDWSYEVPDVVYDAKYSVGLEASPVVGQESISDLVIFTVTNGASGSRMLALNKKTGAVEWQTDFTVETVSSPVAVYNEDGDAWIVQAMSDGQINLLNGKTGEVLDTLKLETQIKASPAVYGNMLVIGTTGKDTSAVYGIQID
ncbi:MAG: PQQ-binding-like beta-propeller repeat protein [Eubacteriales bacterium]|nr:PQQ-binding-like beta-propeller repeat protein [Eubacteriales bacterium]